MRLLTQQAVADGCYAGGCYVRAVEFGDVAAVADDAYAAAEVGLQIHIGRGGDERQHLATVVDECELRRAGAF